MTVKSAVFLSIIVPVYQPQPEHLNAAIESVRSQSDPDWELILVTDGPQPAQVDAVLDDVEDARIRVLRQPAHGGIVATSNRGIAQAVGDFVGFLDNDDVVHRHLVEACRQAVRDFNDVDMLYTDEDKLNPSGHRVEALHKPGWSPERLMSQMYVGHFAAYRRSMLSEIGALRVEFNGSQDHDLALRAGRRARTIVHIPRVLYHWRQVATSTALAPEAKDWAFEAGVRAVADHLAQTKLKATANRLPLGVGVVAIDPIVDPEPELVSIIIVTGGSTRIVRGREVVLIENAIESVVKSSSHPNYEIVVVVDQTSPPELRARLVEIGGGRVRTVQDDEPFNFSRANNLGVSHASGDTLIFLNDDCEVITPDWIERMSLWMKSDGVGAVGCCLEYPDGTIQHAGVYSNPGGPSHRAVGAHSDETRWFQSLHLTTNALAVTGACLGIERRKFFEVGGFSVQFPLNFNDVDLCLKLLSKGWRNVLDNRTRMVHLESSSRVPTVESWEHLQLLDRWTWILSNDPFHNSNFISPGVDETPPSTLVTRLREAVGEVPESRSWPLGDVGGSSVQVG